MLYNVLLIIQIMVAIGIIGLVLIQHGKGADAGAAFGGGASGTVFGSRGSGNFLTKLTTVLAIAFFANSLLLAWLVAHPDNIGDSTTVIPTSITEQQPAATKAPDDIPGGSAPALAPTSPTEGTAPAQKTAPANNAPTDIPK